MKVKEIEDQFHLWAASVRVKNPEYSMNIEVAVYAKTSFMARQILVAQYGRDSIISNVRRIDKDKSDESK